MNKIRELREEIGMTARELAGLIGVTPSMMGFYEKGVSFPRDSKVWDKLAELFNVSIAHVMGLSTDVEYITYDFHHLSTEIKQPKEIPITYMAKTITDLEVLLLLSHLNEEEKRSLLMSM